MTNQVAAGGGDANSNEQSQQQAATGGATAASDAGQGKSFNPLSEPAERKPQRQVITDGGAIPGFIPEPTEFDLPPVRNEGDPLLERKEPSSGAVTPPPPPGPAGAGPAPSSYGGQQSHPYGHQPQQQQTKPPPPREREPLVKPMKDLSPQEKNLAAEQAAKMMMLAYKRANKGLSAIVKIGPYKQWKMERDGKIDLDLPFIGTRSGQAITPRQFFQQYNADNDEVFTVTPEFEDEVMPPLIRICEKRGIGATDEAVVITLFTLDVAPKIGMCMNLLRQRAMTIDGLQKTYKAIKEGQAPEPPPQQTYTPPPTQAQAQQQQAPPQAQQQQPSQPQQQQRYDEQPPGGDLVYDEGMPAEVSSVPMQDWALSEMRQRQDIAGAGGVEHSRIEKRWGDRETLKRGSQISARLKKQREAASGKALPAPKKTAKKK